MKAVEILRAAREKISKPECWTKGAFGRDLSGKAVNSAAASCWCAIGALRSIRVVGSPWEAAYAALVLETTEELGIPVCTWNDAPERTHVEVLAAFDRAIARLEAA